MNETTFKHKFKLNERVKHITNGSPIGIILDISWSFQFETIKYLITFSTTQQDWYMETELKKTK